MGLEESLAELRIDNDENRQSWEICEHAFSDLTHVSPVVFVSLLKGCYIHGTCKATKKFQALQQQVFLALHNHPPNGPAVFILQCLYVLPNFGLFCEGLSHLIVSCLRRYLKLENALEELADAKDRAAQLFLDILGGSVSHDDGVLLKILEAYDVQLDNIERAMSPSKEDDGHSTDKARNVVENYIYKFVESQSYMAAVTLLEQFSIRQSGQTFLLSMIQINQFKAAEKWATYMGKPLLCLLVQEYLDRNMLSAAYQIIKMNDLRQDYPEIYYKYKERSFPVTPDSLKKLAGKGCWEIAEIRTKKDRQLLEYLVLLAMESGYEEKVAELCDRYSLEGYLLSVVPDASFLKSDYLNLEKLAVEEIIWVDEVDALHNATCHFEECKVVGLDCEWKPNYIKGSPPSKVSIMQIASDRKVFILDLIKLSNDAPNIMDSCLSRILQSPRILKLGYNFQCDIKQLAHSYGDFSCFRNYERLLDIQNLFVEPRGGLSGLAKKILGGELNKTRRNSNWEERPLTQYQLEYAALDAVVLIHIFQHVRNQSLGNGDSEGNERTEWKSYIVSHKENPSKRSKSKSKKC